VYICSRRPVSADAIWANDNLYAISKPLYEVCFSVKVWAGIITSAAWQADCGFLENVLPGTTENMPLAVRWKLRFQRDRTAAQCRKDVLQWLTATSRNVDWKSKTDCMATSVARSNSDGFYPVGAPQRAGLCSPFEDYR
jgi:hypothetical protein